MFDCLDLSDSHLGMDLSDDMPRSRVSGLAVVSCSTARMTPAISFAPDVLDEPYRVQETWSGTCRDAADKLCALEQLLFASIAWIGALEQRLMQVESDASLDPLTGLANRHRFDMTLRDAVRHANAESAPLTLLMLDIDHFKRFNDTLGHLMGDHVLRLTARVMTGQTRQGDLVARYGGEEFAIVLPGASLAVGAAVAEQIRQVMERRPVADRGDGQRVGAATCSVGVAQYRSGEMAEDLIERADQAMYRAKRAGRNRVETDGPPPAWDRASRDVSISGSYIEHY